MFHNYVNYMGKVQLGKILNPIDRRLMPNLFNYDIKDLKYFSKMFQSLAKC